MTVKLSDLIDGFEMAMNETSVYLDKQTGEVFSISEDDRLAFEEEIDDAPEWQKEHLKRIRPLLEEDIIDSNRYIELPDKFDFNEYTYMERFVLSLENDFARKDLYRAIKGSGAFQRFRSGIRHFKVEDEWYKYRDSQLKQMLLDWCEFNEVKFVDDTNKVESD
jgi:hypothetical protein